MSDPAQVRIGEELVTPLLEVLRDYYVGGDVFLTQQGDGSLVFADQGHTFEITTEGNVLEV